MSLTRTRVSIVTITEHGTMGFRIASDGKATEMTRNELDDVFR
jgi:hypothetical protein